MDHQDKPPVAAVFLVVFDQKVGYTIAWKRAAEDVDLDGVEFKSLPSGLHAVKSDLVYFLHHGHAGVSAFVRGTADAKHRNANFVAVGALVPLSYGRLGRAWNHAEELRRLAKAVVDDASDTRPLELYWKRHRLDKSASAASPLAKRSEPNSPIDMKKRKRALSDATMAGLGSHIELPPDHPALFMADLLDTFGPLLFPLHRAALLRKRILMLGSAPVQKDANAVYITSILSSIPQTLYESLPNDVESLLSGRPLFSVGVHDIAALAEAGNSQGYLACTTDDILAEKKDLYDILVKLPATGRGWPELRCSDGRIIKASQRDMRRWQLLRRELNRVRRQCMERPTDEAATAAVAEEDDHDQQPLLSHRGLSSDPDSELSRRDKNEVVEPSSWTALAYRGFMWWASAGEASAWENEEMNADEEVLFDLPNIAEILPNAPNNEPSIEESTAYYARAVATIVVAYFRRLTVAMFKPLAEIVEEADDSTEQGIQDEEIPITLDSLRDIGLDTWSATDKEFIKQLAKVWFQRDLAVADAGVKVCGLRVC